MASVDALLKKVDSLHDRATAEDELPIRYECFWGDEEVPDDGTPLYITEWGGGALDDEDDEDDEGAEDDES